MDNNKCFFLCILRGENRAKRQNNNLITSGSLVFHCLSLSLPSFPTPHLLIQVINRSIMVKKELGKQNLHEKWIMLSINYIFQQIRRTKQKQIVFFFFQTMNNCTGSQRALPQVQGQLHGNLARSFPNSIHKTSLDHLIQAPSKEHKARSTRSRCPEIPVSSFAWS